MAAAKTKAAPVGSSQWIQNEREQADTFVAQEFDEFGFSVRNELEWLNEHMAEIFTTTQVNFADMFKTPGKLRGKTPRTAHKVAAVLPRQPLTDVFAPNAQPPTGSPQKTTFYDKVAQFQIAEDVENRAPQSKPISRGTSPQRAGKPCTDSGYHGMMTEDEMELEAQTQTTESAPASSQMDEPQMMPAPSDQATSQQMRDSKTNETGNSDESFVSAKEQDSQGAGGVVAEGGDITADIALVDMVQTQDTPDTAEDDVLRDAASQDEHALGTDQEAGSENEKRVVLEADAEMVDVSKEQDVDMDMEAGTPQSDGSSPEKPLQRKSSFTFSSLPAREPLGAKKSMGQIDRHRSSVFNKSINNKPLEADDDDLDVQAQEKPAEARAHSKSSTQLLHERLNMLGKTKEARSSKSIPQNVLGAQAIYPQLPETDHSNSQATETSRPHAPEVDNVAPEVDDEDDWIAPSKAAPPLPPKTREDARQLTDPEKSPARPLMHQKSASAYVLPSPGKADVIVETRPQTATSVSHPNLGSAVDTTTPAGSPKRPNEGHLSASKSRLWSALKSAKNIFASSAGASAAAKLEAHNNSPAFTRSQKRESGDSKIFNMPGALYSKAEFLQSPTRNNSVISFSPSRKTRNSNESEKKREKELKAQQKAAEELEKVREKEKQKAAKQQAEEKAKAEKAEKIEVARLEKERKQAEKQSAPVQPERPATAGSEKTSDADMPPPPPPKTSMLPAGKLRAPGRLMRPGRDQAQSKPAPVSIRVASQSQRAGQGPSTSSFSKSQHESSAPAPLSKSTGPVPRSSSAMGNRPGTAAPGNARVKALEAAARKKEADEKAAAKKAEEKRKRAEKAEQDKRAEEERKAAEQQRVQEAKQAALKRAAEKQAAEALKREKERLEQQRREHDRLEQQRREQERLQEQRREQEQLRQHEEARKAREAHDLAEAIRRERAQQAQTHARGDVPGTLRQLTKNIIPGNPAKPAKRQLPMDDDEPGPQPQRPGMMRGPPSYQQTDAKRRRTNEEQDEPNEQRQSVMAPPKRPSTMRKETLTKFSHGYTHAPPPAAHHASMFKSTVTAQHQMQHSNKPTHPSQLVQMSSARIPFADNASFQASSHQVQSSSVHPGYENASSNKFKTPVRPVTAPKSAKSTPHYPQGDNIELPDIATDSEDESDEEETGGGGFRAPSWVASPALRELLTQQQLVDPETVFGPIGELRMDEVFKNSKNQERLKRFRERGSSAMWVESGDAVTSAEKKKDMELRERVVREGGWRYEPDA